MVITTQEQLGYVKLKLTITETKDGTEQAARWSCETELPYEVFNCEDFRTISYS